MRTRLDIMHTRYHGHAVLAASGDLDSATREPMRLALFQALATARPVILELSRVEFIDSSGLSLLIRPHRAASARGQFLCVIASPSVARLLERTGTDRTLRVHLGLSAALSASISAQKPEPAVKDGDTSGATLPSDDGPDPWLGNMGVPV